MRGMKETVTNNKTQGDEHVLPCGHCHVETKHVVLQSIDVDGKAMDWDYYTTDSYQIVQCKGCESKSFRKIHSNSEDMMMDEDTGEPFYMENEELYPSRIAGRHKLRESHFLPIKVQRIYDETYLAITNRQPILSGIGIRALVEAVCNEESASGRDLEKRIDDLVVKGTLTQAGAEVLHNIRTLGNIAAHEVKPHTNRELAIAMDVVENLLYNVYLLPKAANQLPQRKKKAPSGTTAPSTSATSAPASSKTSKKSGAV